MSTSHQLKFHQLAGPYAIIRLAADAAVPSWAMKGSAAKGGATKEEFLSIARTADELSIVCPLANLPPAVHSSHRWVCLKLEGPFPFSQTGVLLSFIEPLSDNCVPIFAVSTYDTDYVLIQEEFEGKAIRALQQAGHELCKNMSSAKDAFSQTDQATRNRRSTR